MKYYNKSSLMLAFGAPNPSVSLRHITILPY